MDVGEYRFYVSVSGAQRSDIKSVTYALSLTAGVPVKLMSPVELQPTSVMSNNEDLICSDLTLHLTVCVVVSAIQIITTLKDEFDNIVQRDIFDGNIVVSVKPSTASTTGGSFESEVPGISLDPFPRLLSVTLFFWSNYFRNQGHC